MVVSWRQSRWTAHIKDAPSAPLIPKPELFEGYPPVERTCSIKPEISGHPLVADGPNAASTLPFRGAFGCQDSLHGRSTHLSTTDLLFFQLFLVRHKDFGYRL
jgi:hypothetical protein